MWKSFVATLQVSTQGLALPCSRAAHFNTRISGQDEGGGAGGHGDHRSRPAQAIGDDRGPRQPGDLASYGPVPHRCAQLPPAARRRPAVARARLGRGGGERDRVSYHAAAAGQRGAGAGCARQAGCPGPGVRYRAGSQDRRRGRARDRRDRVAGQRPARDQHQPGPGRAADAAAAVTSSPAPRPSTGCTASSWTCLPGGAPVKKSTEQYKALLARVRPKDAAGQMRRRMAAEELADLTRLDAKLKAMKAELKAAVAAT